MAPVKNFFNSGIFNKPFVVFICAALGIAAGVSIFFFIYAKGYSYISNDPKACTNCHVMQEDYDSWAKSSHHQAAACNDCHLPRGFIERCYAKISNGFNYSRSFTLQNFVEPVRIAPLNLDALQYNCAACHSSMPEDIAAHKDAGKDQARCTQCHRSIGHRHQN
ncbi:MAG: cytochrome c nitrite reductase small subunit [Candidatus Omnitrophica bacterium]|nr:cytochrome c nitrite reductase small subunit [Candidatus Omnitrophota bacterium]